MELERIINKSKHNIIFEKYIDKWDWSYLSNNHALTFDIVDKYIDKPWTWYTVSGTVKWNMMIPWFPGVRGLGLSQAGRPPAPQKTTPMCFRKP